MTVSKLSAIAALSLANGISGGPVFAQETPRPILIDGEPWAVSRASDQCEARVPAAIARYWESRRYPKEWSVEADRYLTNGSGDCWIELVVEGVDDVSYLFKVTEGHQAIDRRGLSWWGMQVYPYPEGPPYPY